MIEEAREAKKADDPFDGVSITDGFIKLSDKRTNCSPFTIASPAKAVR